MLMMRGAAVGMTALGEHAPGGVLIGLPKSLCPCPVLSPRPLAPSRSQGLGLKWLLWKGTVISAQTATKTCAKCEVSFWLHAVLLQNP